MLTAALRRSIFIGCGCAALAGCNQQDSEILARIGHKLLDRSHTTAEAIRAQVDGDLKGLPQAALGGRECGVKEKIEQRLRSDAMLADVRLEVRVSGDEVELRGTVKSDAQRRRATDLAETTAGVQAVNDLLKIEE
jgi:osmotically-inducible protein OsmY